MRYRFNTAVAGTVAAATLVFGIGTASAAQIVQVQGFNTFAQVTSSANVSVVTDNLNDFTGNDLTFNQFDAALGTLDSVVLEITSILAQGSASALFRDDDFFNDTAGLTTINALSVKFAIGGAAFSRNRNHVTDTCSNASPFSGSSCTISISYNHALSNISANLSSTLFGNFTGLGSITMFIDQFGSAFFDETDGDNDYIDTRSSFLSASGDVSLTYNFTEPAAPMSEPAALGLLGLGLAGLGVAARRRRTR